MKEIKIGFKTFEITWETLGGELGGVIATRKGKRYEYYHFNDVIDFNRYVSTNKSLAKHGIVVPKIVAKDKHELVVVREHFDEENCLSLLSKGEIDDKIFEQLFTQYRNCRLYKFDINYMPENYVYVGKYLYYLGAEMNNKSERYSLENDGLFYWVYSKQGIGHLKDNGYQVSAKQLSDGEAKKAIVLLTIKYW